MLTDHWVIGLLLIQLFSFLLMGRGAFMAMTISARWDAHDFGEGQLFRERQTYLLSAIARIVLVFQMATLVFLLATLNSHLPGLLKGAMCATGSLQANGYGWPLLALKCGAVLLCFVFLWMDKLDDAEPGYPLTPQKLWILYPLTLMLGVELILMVLYFKGINPDIITTCCSVAFSAHEQASYFNLAAQLKPVQVLGAQGGSLLLLAGWMVWGSKRMPWVGLLLSFLFVFCAVLALKNHYVRYIYGLPTHNCLFDIFLPHYHAVGYPIFFGYYLLLYAMVGKVITHRYKHKLQADLSGWATRNQRQAWWGIGISTIIPLAYWLLWFGWL